MSIELNTNNLLDLIGRKFENDELNNDSLIQIIELAGGYLNLRTISKYSKDSGISYNGAKKFRRVIQLFGSRYVIDNV